MDGWNTTFLLGRPIFRGYVSFREGNHLLNGMVLQVGHLIQPKKSQITEATEAPEPCERIIRSRFRTVAPRGRPRFLETSAWHEASWGSHMFGRTYIPDATNGTGIFYLHLPCI